MIYQTGADYNEGLATNFEAEFEANGGQIVASETYSAGDVDFKTQLTTILNAGPEVVYCPNYYEDVGQILTQATDVGLDVPFLGGDGWDGVTPVRHCRAAGRLLLLRQLRHRLQPRL